MHSIVLLTAMTATSGLFGRQKVETPRMTMRTAPAVYSSCQTGACGRTPSPAPSYGPMTTYAPATVPSMAPTVAAPTYSSYYYPTGCASGTCTRR